MKKYQLISLLPIVKSTEESSISGDAHIWQKGSGSAIILVANKKKNREISRNWDAKLTFTLHLAQLTLIFGYFFSEIPLST